MFGYVIPDKPNMLMKDFTEFRAYYCGLCKAIGRDNPAFLRLLTNYDCTFLTVLLHNLAGSSPEIRMQGCVLNPVKKKPVAAKSDLMKKAAALTVLLMLAFVRSITERGDGRIWAGIFAGAALIQAFCGVPSTPEGSVRPADMPGILAAAIALMLLPHVGRNIMRTRSCAPVIDVLLLILALPGAALALLPMLPGQAWTARLLTLWPLGAIFALLPALALLLRREKGSLLFTLACFAMTAGSLLGLWGMGEGIAAPLWGQAPPPP